MMTFYQKLTAITRKQNSLLCVGLDSDFEKIPQSLKKAEFPQFEFNKAIIEATHDLVSSYKPNSAFYEAQGERGILELKMTCDYLHERYPEIVIVLDAKRADIGNTNNGYTSFIFDYLGVDAVTLHPYLGQEAIQPFLDRKDKGSIILCRTSNPGAAEFQDLVVNNKPLYQYVAEQVTNVWNKNENCALVVGATYPDEMKQVRALAPHMPFLVPGIGAQGGDLLSTIEAGADSAGEGMMINSARGIIFASTGENFTQAARVAAQKLTTEINQFRKGKS
jgi:orotidine-5'-phosphate decarboxylase